MTFQASGSPRPSVMFVTRSLERGGAERQLVALAAGLKSRGWSVSAACFYARGPFLEDLETADVVVHDLRKRGRWDVVGFLIRFIRLVQRERPAIVHGYLPMANLVAFVARFVRFETRVVWGVRASDMRIARYGWLAKLEFFLQCRLSRFADLVVSNSRAGLEYHLQHGFPRKRCSVVPNGIDVRRFRFDQAGRSALRKRWSVPEETVLIGMVARLDPIKGHDVFLAAAAVLARGNPNWRLVCVGSGPAEYARKLRQRAVALGLADSIVWEEARGDMAAVYSAIDVAVSASYGEGFANAVAEAMACGRLCVATDVGDSGGIIGDAGLIVPPGDPHSLAAAIERLMQLGRTERAALAGLARARIESRYDVDRLVTNTEGALRSVAASTFAPDEQKGPW